jgi:hypothetical protein
MSVRRRTMEGMTVCVTEPPSGVAVVAGARGLVIRSIRGRDRVLARVFAWRLDARLAAGAAPEGNWLRAVRAGELTTPVTRARLGAAWRHVVARRGHGAATGNIHQLIDQLEAPGPVPARGVAMAVVLLTDRTGPLHRPRSPEHLAAAVAAVNRYLDRAAPLQAAAVPR